MDVSLRELCDSGVPRPNCMAQVNFFNIRFEKSNDTFCINSTHVLAHENWSVRHASQHIQTTWHSTQKHPCWCERHLLITMSPDAPSHSRYLASAHVVKETWGVSWSPRTIIDIWTQIFFKLEVAIIHCLDQKFVLVLKIPYHRQYFYLKKPHIFSNFRIANRGAPCYRMSRSALWETWVRHLCYSRN